MEPMQSPNNGLPELDVFLQFLFEGLEGYVYLAAKEVDENYNTKDWLQEFFQYPLEEEKLKKTIRAASKSHEIYIAPVIYSEPSADKGAVKASNVVWTEFDGNAPEWNDVNTPSLIVQSSSERNQHVYWRLNSPVEDVAYLENLNRRITYNLGADSSAWDATQVLRPPESWNHKRSTPVGVMTKTDHVYDSQVFITQYEEPPPLIETEWEQTDLPTAESVLLKYALTPDIIKLLGLSKADVADRSTSLMNLAYACAQLNMTSTEIMTLLVLMDDKWEKFKDRKDRMKRLGHIVTLAKNKHPGTTDSGFDDAFAIAFGWETFLQTEVNVDWLIEGMLMEQGNMLLVGPSGLGKTQFTLQTLIHMALGKDFLHYKIAEPKKVMFLSLEMGLGELKIFAEAMSGPLTTDDLALLEENFIVIPHGEPWPLNKPEGQAQLNKFIEIHEPTLLAVDSLGSSISGNISSDESVQPFTEYVDKVRNRYNLAWWSIHHMRKSKDGPPTQDDVYGNQYLLNRSTSTYALLRSKQGLIRVRNFKMRMAAQEQDFFIERVDGLNFRKITEGVDDIIAHSIDHLNGGGQVSDKAGGGKFSL